MRPRVLALVLAAGALLPAAAAAQDDSMVIRGRILGPAETAIAGQPVVLHRVQGGEGTTIADASTSDVGEFELSVPAPTDTSAIYFVATRYEGELYIGAPFRAGDPANAVQVIQVGVPGTSASAMLGGGPAPQQGGRPVTNRNWLLLMIPLVGVSAVAVYALVPRGSIPADRALLIRVAELDEQMAAAPAARRETLLEERSRLMAQLRAG